MRQPWTQDPGPAPFPGGGSGREWVTREGRRQGTRRAPDAQQHGGDFSAPATDQDQPERQQRLPEAADFRTMSLVLPLGDILQTPCKPKAGLTSGRS